MFPCAAVKDELIRLVAEHDQRTTSHLSIATFAIRRPCESQTRTASATEKSPWKRAKVSSQSALQKKE
jgi:hypothetical protein